MTQSTEKVGLIFHWVRSTNQLDWTTVVMASNHLCIMPTGDKIEFLLVDTIQEASKFDPRIAQDIRIRCPAGGGRLVGKDGSPLDMEAFTKTITFYLTAVFNVMRHAAAAMARQEPDENGARRVIINTASNAALEGQIGQFP